MNSNTHYGCDNCTWTGRMDDTGSIDDAEERIEPGELMPAGQCPDCGALIDIDDADVPDYVLDQVKVIMRARGWTVAEPGQAAPGSGPAKPRPLDGLR